MAAEDETGEYQRTISDTEVMKPFPCFSMRLKSSQACSIYVPQVIESASRRAAKRRKTRDITQDKALWAPALPALLDGYEDSKSSLLRAEAYRHLWTTQSGSLEVGHSSFASSETYFDQRILEESNRDIVEDVYNFIAKVDPQE